MENAELTLEECKALYFDEKALVEPSRVLYRLTGHSGGRFYYTFDKDGEIIFFISVTNMLDKTMPTSPYLIKWIADMGQDKAREFANMRAEYGTMMHTEYSNLLITKTLDLDALSDKVEDYLLEAKQPAALHESWCNELKKDILAFARFVYDYEVVPLAIEVVLGSDINGDAGAMDLLCKMKIEVDGKDHNNPYKSGLRKGEPRDCKVKKEVIAIVDYKSGKNGFYETHEIQLGSYRQLVKENFPQFKDEEIMLFNFAPKDWRKEPQYTLKDQSNSRNLDKLPYLHALGKIELSKRKQTALVIEGYIDLNNKAEALKNNYNHVEIAGIIKKSHNGRKN